MNRSDGIDIYNSLKINMINLGGDIEKVEIKALLNGKEVGVARLQESKVSLFNQGGLSELELVSISIDNEFEGEGVISFLMYHMLELVKSHNRVLTINDGYFPIPYLIRRGFEVESITECDTFVYGDNYHYTLENISSEYFYLLDEDKLDRIDKKFIDRKLKTEKEVEKKEALSKIMDELQQDFVKILKNTDLKLEEAGFSPMFLMEQFLETLDLDLGSDLSFNHDVFPFKEFEDEDYEKFKDMEGVYYGSCLGEDEDDCDFCDCFGEEDYADEEMYEIKEIDKLTKEILKKFIPKEDIHENIEIEFVMYDGDKKYSDIDDFNKHKNRGNMTEVIKFLLNIIEDDEDTM